MSLKLFYNARFYSLRRAKFYDWLLEANGKIVALGCNSDMPALTNKIDLQGKTVLPAFTDAHTHFAMTALYNSRIQLNAAQSLKEALAILHRAAKERPKERWLLGSGYDKNVWRDGSPHKTYLDKMFPGRPVCLESKDCHTLWLNSAALSLARIGRNTAHPPGGRIGRDKDGSPNGILYENARSLVEPFIPDPSAAEIAAAVEKNCRNFHSRGITTVHTMEGVEEFKAFQILQRKQNLRMRITQYLPHSNLETMIKSGIRSAFGDEWLRLGGIKIFADGSLGSQTAAMLEPYEHSQNYGVENLSPAELNGRIALSLQNGLSVAVHAIGDKALLSVLTAFEKAGAPMESSAPNRIEHAQLIPDEQFEQFEKLSLVASVQPLHIADDVPLAERFWGRRSKNAYPFKRLIVQGIPLAFGSDTPVADYDPFKGIYSAVKRKYKMNPSAESWHPEQAISVRQAVRAYTLGGAFAAGEQDYKGTLSPGNLADFIVLDKDIFTVPADYILQIRVLRTYLNGTSVYEQ